MRSFFVALAFLTIVPIRFRTLPGSAAVARSRFWYPVVGTLLGAALGGWTALLAWWGKSPPLSAFLILLAWVVLTGALHLDGFCDLSDGLFGGRTPEDRLRILKDPHLGTFGLAGGVLLLLGKFVLLAEVLRWPHEAPWVVGGAVAVSRCLVLCMAAVSRYPRPEGTGKALIEAARPWELALFAALGGAATAGVALGANWPGLWLGAVAGLGVVLLLTAPCQRRLGGVTGDCLGAGIELVELTFLLTAVWLP
ncbi:MAG: adenosylcobinamide-GDP ribazoletransferase [Gemmataceae bacterium]|nr:adenosylcobinamide-GDP ribazoletransferase [Gemmataceae bacterium]